MIDVADPTDPQIVSTVDTPGDCLGIAVGGAYAYVAAGGSGLQVLDLSNPTSPQVVGSVDTVYARSAFVSGHYVYVAAGAAGLSIVDVTNPTSPQLIANVALPDQAVGVDLSGSYAVVANNASGIEIVDVWNPHSPRLVGGTGLFGGSFIRRGIRIRDLCHGRGLRDVCAPCAVQSAVAGIVQ